MDPRPGAALRAFLATALLATPLLAASPAEAEAATPAALPAQDPDSVVRPRPPDTLARPLERDTLAQDTVPVDTLPPPPPRLPDLANPGPVGWAGGVWAWSRDELVRLPDLSLLHLLERVPGLTPVRTHFAGQAESPAVFGAGAGAIRYVVDGFELDPLTGPTLDASRLPLLALESVRVERRPTGATVWIETLSPSDPRAESIIEAGTGDFDTNLFRGMLLLPSALGGPLGLGFERLSTDGFGSGGFNQIGGWLKWTFVRDSTGVQLLYRQSAMNRDGVGAGLEGERRDWALRARTRRWGVTGEVFAGASSLEDALGDALTLREGTAQGGVQLSATPVWPFPSEVRAAARLRSHPRLPGRELELQSWHRPLPWLGVGLDYEIGYLDDPEGSELGHTTLSARLGPLLGLTAFAQLEPRRTRAVFGPPDPSGFADSALHVVEREGFRAGLELDLAGVRAGAALIETAADSAAGLGLTFDAPTPLFPVDPATGYEAYVSLPTGWRPLRVEGWYTGFQEPPRPWPYLPEYHWRAGVAYHQLPLPSGNLEIYLMAEHEFRGGMWVPVAASTTAPAALGRVGSYRASNLELTIRVLTVRAFLRWNNMFNRREMADVPGFALPGTRVVYGVKWTFHN